MKDATIDLILQAVLLPFADASVRTLVTCQLYEMGLPVAILSTIASPSSFW